MRNVISIILVLFIIFASAGKTFAAPTNGVRMPPQGRVEAGYEYNQMSSRLLRHDTYGRIATRDHFATLSVGLFDWLTIDGKAGNGDVTHKNGIYAPDLAYGGAFVGGYGIRLKMFDLKPSEVFSVLSAQHISIHPKDKLINGVKYQACVDEWQLSLSIAKRFRFGEIAQAMPYAGIKGSDAEIVYDMNNNDEQRRYSRYNVGFLFGSDILFFDDKLRINIEARFFDETAFSTGISWLF